MDARLIIDRDRCAGTGVCLPIAAAHLQLVDGIATADGAPVILEQARAAAACCPNEAITVCEREPGGFGLDTPIVTLGPAGTDAEAEARKHTSVVRLVDSFADAMAAATAGDARALVAAGYLALDADDRTTDSWVDQHFTHTGTLRLHRCWESPTKPMCLAVRRDLPRQAPVATVATHPATRVFATRYAPGARLVPVDAKPLAARAAAHGEVDACIASVDVVARYPQLEVRVEWQPTMVWLLYGSGGGDE
ncbi:ferredoxin [Nocardia farcinica]|uniref:ferredoxin n=1 Tax=Nocardia farcinica TaxID=37329 RepID=UPI0018963166|nr:ferredoxin [Nocardia farcinica]MBF6388112.1 ferredoxin [Nocardia farcinica]UEX26390.1 ferredoxin [Nocardia farcinica]